MIQLRPNLRPGNSPRRRNSCTVEQSQRNSSATSSSVRKVCIVSSSDHTLGLIYTWSSCARVSWLFIRWRWPPAHSQGSSSRPGWHDGAAAPTVKGFAPGRGATVQALALDHARWSMCWGWPPAQAMGSGSWPGWRDGAATPTLKASHWSRCHGAGVRK